MEFRLEKNIGRGIRVVVDGKHFKTVPKSLSKAVNYKTIDKMGITGKRLSPIERKLLSQFAAYENWKEKLAKNEKHLFKLIEKAIPVQKNHVFTQSGARLELVLDNKIKITVPEKVYYSLLLTENTIHSNF